MSEWLLPVSVALALLNLLALLVLIWSIDRV